MIRHITPDAHAPQVPLTPEVRAGDWVFVSGQIAGSGTVLTSDFEKEVDLAIDNVGAVLSAAGASFSDVVKVSAFLSTPLLFARFNEVYARRFSRRGRPARRWSSASAIPTSASRSRRSPTWGRRSQRSVTAALTGRSERLTMCSPAANSGSATTSAATSVNCAT